VKRRQRKAQAMLWPLLATVLALVIAASLLARGWLEHRAERARPEQR
jgi:hypothetical protein